MLEYLEDALRERAHEACFEFRKIQEFDKDFRDLQNRLMDIEKAIPREFDDAYTECEESRNAVDAKLHHAIFRAGWIDGIVTGVQAASRK